jgi:hypothetical protein
VVRVDQVVEMVLLGLPDLGEDPGLGVTWVVQHSVEDVARERAHLIRERKEPFVERGAIALDAELGQRDVHAALLAE